MASVQVNQIRQELDLENRKELRQHAQSHEDRGGNAYCATLGDPIIDYYPHEVKQDEMEAQSVKYNLRGELGFELTPPMFPLRIKPGISVENTTEYTVYQCLVTGIPVSDRRGIRWMLKEGAAARQGLYIDYGLCLSIPAPASLKQVELNIEVSAKLSSLVGGRFINPRPCKFTAMLP